VLIIAHFPHFFIRAQSILKNMKVTQGYGVLLRPLFALALFGAALSGMQTFIERLGDWHGGTTVDIGHALAFGWCLAIFSPFLVVPFIHKYGGVKALLGSYLLVAIIALSLSLDLSLSYYLLVAAIFTPAALFIESLQFGILGSMDNTGKLAALGPAAISLGSGVGPFIAGGLVGTFGLQSIGVMACTCFVISIFVLFPLAVSTYKKVSY
jgi:predicted MFS family arabinose efflux permease